MKCLVILIALVSIVQAVERSPVTEISEIVSHPDKGSNGQLVVYLEDNGTDNNGHTVDGFWMEVDEGGKQAMAVILSAFHNTSNVQLRYINGNNWPNSSRNIKMIERVRLLKSNP